MTVAAGARGHHAVELVEVNGGVALERAARGILDAARAVGGEEREEVLDVDLAVGGDVGGARRRLDGVGLRRDLDGLRATDQALEDGAAELLLRVGQ